MLYQFNEGSLELPNQAINKTLHMLVLNQAEGLSFSMIVSGMLAGEDVERFIDRQAKTLSRQLKKFKETRREHIVIAPKDRHDKPIDAVLLETQFQQGDQLFFQKQCIALMGSERALVATVNANSPFTDSQLDIWRTAYESIRFSPQA